MYDPYSQYAAPPQAGAQQQLGQLPQIPQLQQLPAYAAYGPPPGAPVMPLAYAMPPQQGPPGGGDELRTIYITGFPPDMRERELNNLLRFLPGYTASQLNWKNGQVHAGCTRGGMRLALGARGAARGAA